MPPIPRIGNKSLAIYEVSFWRFSHRKVMQAWNGACKFWSIYGYSKPRVNRSMVDARGNLHGEEIAGMNFAEKRITVNLHRLERLGLDLLDAVFVHELGHKFCPGDLKTLLLVNSAVKEVIEDEFSSGIIGNLYRDMLVNTDAHRRGEKGIHTFYSRAWKDAPDEVQQVIGRAYEKLFQRQDTSMAYAGTIIRVKPSSEIEDSAEKVASIILNSRRSNWLRSAREFAQILKQYASGMSAGAMYVISNILPQDFSPAGKTPIPPQGRSDVKELEKRLGGVVYELRQLEGEDDRQPCSIHQFKKFLNNSKINVTDNEALIWYYRDLIGGKVIKVPEVSVASGSLYPFAPKTWMPGDPPQELDVVLSKSVGGVLIPGVTTKKWIKKRGQHLNVGKDYPDLDLWIDCSPSMIDPAEGVSHAVTTGMIVSKSFLATRKSVRVVSWSGDHENKSPRFETTKGFVRDEDEIDRRLLDYHGNWTLLPMAEFEKPYRKKGKEKYIVMITDMGIANLDEGTVSRLREVFNKSVGGTVFLIGPGREDVQEILEDIGFDVVPVKDPSDLDQHALKLTKQLFEERIVI